jgi:hypothetical protein
MSSDPLLIVGLSRNSGHNVVPDLIRDPGDLEKPGSQFTGMTELASGAGIAA